jgi:hypothetical protein
MERMTIGSIAYRLDGGLDGEPRSEATATALPPDPFTELLAGSHVVLLRDRELPGFGAPIDYIAIGRGGVTIVDGQPHGGKARIRGDRLLVGDEDRTDLVEEILRQVVPIRDALVEERLGWVPVEPALCLLDGKGLPFRRQLRMGHVVIERPTSLAKTLLASGQVDRGTIKRLATVIDDRFRPAAALAQPA